MGSTDGKGKDVGDDERVLLSTDSGLRRSNSSSSVTSSSNSFDEDFFQLDDDEVRKSNVDGDITKLPPLTEDPQLAPVADFPDDGNGPPIKSDIISVDKEFANTSSLTQSPPIQVMGKSDGPDAYRIPSSVFARTKSTTPMEWSVASNESLFSIHPGNSSFSRDHVFLLGRSGELNFSSPPSGLPTPLPSPSKNPNDTKSLNIGEGPVPPAVTEAANAEAMKEVLRAAAEDHGKAEPHPSEVPRSASSRRSDASGASTRSFAFPILTEGKSGSVKMETNRQHQPQEQRQQSQSGNPEATPNASEGKWFPCFSCCPFCC